MTLMNKTFILIAALLILSSHDMFLKPEGYYLHPQTEATIALYNGTFESSENVIDRDRMIDVSLVGNGIRTKVDTSSWTERDKTTYLKFKTGDEGTWVAGLSTYARNIEMDGTAFNRYLDHDGVLDMLAWRKENNALDSAATEKYSKHVKTIYQVGKQRTDDWKVELGYPIEFVPMANPYEARRGDHLPVRLLRDGKPLANQLVYTVSAHGHGHTHSHEDTEEDHQHHDANQLTTDKDGIVTMHLTEEGVWYLRSIHMTLSDEPGLTHESNWATLTFEVGHGHSHSHGIPKYAYLIAGLLIAGLLGLWWMKR